MKKGAKNNGVSLLSIVGFWVSASPDIVVLNVLIHGVTPVYAQVPKNECFSNEGIPSIVKGMCLEVFFHDITEQVSEMYAAF